MMGDDVPLPKEKCDPINIRDLYFGGRTNAIVLHSEFPKNSKGGYLDFCSLYPYVLKYERCTIGHPPILQMIAVGCTLPSPGYRLLPRVALEITLFWSNEGENLPLCKLLFPILPIKINGKLIFPLCCLCAENEDKGHCTCPFQSCALIHTWCMLELTLTINMGYNILDIYKVLHWPSNEKIDNSTGKGGLFTEYTNMFLHIKTQASGYPDSVHSLEQKQEYIEEYTSNEGVILDPKS